MTLRLTIFVLIMTGLFTQLADAEAVTPGHPAPRPSAAADHVILFVLEGVDRQSLKTGPMPALSRLADLVKRAPRSFSLSAQMNPPLCLTMP